MCYLLMKEIKNTQTNSLVSFLPNLGLKKKKKLILSNDCLKSAH